MGLTAKAKEDLKQLHQKQKVIEDKDPGKCNRLSLPSDTANMKMSEPHIPQKAGFINKTGLLIDFMQLLGVYAAQVPLPTWQYVNFSIVLNLDVNILLPEAALQNIKGIRLALIIVVSLVLIAVML